MLTLHFVNYLLHLLQIIKIKIMNSLVNPLFKKWGLFVTILGIFLLLTIRIWSPQFDEAGYIDKVMFPFHFIIIFGLMMLTFSKEKIDDEGIQKIRYFTTKFSFRLVIILIPAYLMVTNLDRVSFSVYPIFYIIEGVLIFYQVVFRIGLKMNPKIMYSEATGKNTGFIILLICILILIFTIISGIFEHLVK